LCGELSAANAECYRAPDESLPDRYSHHYYDVALLSQGEIGTEAPSDKELLIQVLRHKETFYPSARARYDLARPGSFRLVPGENRVPVLETDYRNKAVMTFSRRLYSIGL